MSDSRIDMINREAAAFFGAKYGLIWSSSFPRS